MSMCFNVPKDQALETAMRDPDQCEFARPAKKLSSLTIAIIAQFPLVIALHLFE